MLFVCVFVCACRAVFVCLWLFGVFVFFLFVRCWLCFKFVIEVCD